MIKIFDDYLSAQGRLGKPVFRIGKETCRIEQPSSSVENQIDVFVQSGTFEGCQAIIQNVMEDCASATFTIPAKSADGLYVAVGHYIKSYDELPEL